MSCARRPHLPRVVGAQQRRGYRAHTGSASATQSSANRRPEIAINIWHREQSSEPSSQRASMLITSSASIVQRRVSRAGAPDEEEAS